MKKNTPMTDDVDDIDISWTESRHHEDGFHVAPDGEVTPLVDDVSLSIDNQLDAADQDINRIAPPGDTEFTASFTVELDTDRTTCPDCGTANDIADPAFLFFLDVDPRCRSCRRPLGVVR